MRRKGEPEISNSAPSDLNMVRAVRDGASVEALEQMIENGADPNSVVHTESLGEPTRIDTPFTAACRMQNVPLVRFFAGRGADVDFKTERNWTAIHRAAAADHTDVIETLLSLGADPNIPDINGQLPSSTALLGGRVGASQALIRAGAAHRLFTAAGGSPTIPQIGARDGNLPLLDLCFSVGAPIMDVDERGNTLAHIAAVNGRVAVVDELGKKVRALLSAVNNEGHTPLSAAVAALVQNLNMGAYSSLSGAPGVVSVCSGQGVVLEDLVGLVKAGCDPDGPSATSAAAAGACVRPTPPIIIAAAGGHSALVQMLLNVGASLGARDAFGRTAVDHACTPGGYPAFETVASDRSAGPLLALPSLDGITPLHTAASWGVVGAVVGLITRMPIAAVAAVGPLQRTPLHLAALGGHVGAVNAILSAVKGEGDRSVSSRRPAHQGVGVRGRRKDASDSLIVPATLCAEEDIDGHTPLQLALQSEAGIPAALALLSHWADVRRMSAQYGTPLHMAVRLSDPMLVSKVLAAGAVVDARGADSLTPLHVAAQLGVLSVIRVLTAACARSSLNVLSLDRSTPLHVAVLRGPNAPNEVAVIDELLRAGANPAVRDNCGRAPLHLAAQFASPAVVGALLDAGAPLAAGPEEVSALLAACAAGRFDNALIICAHDAALDVPDLLSSTDPDGLTCLHYAAAYGDCQAIVSLAVAGAPLNAADRHRRTPLMTAAENRMIESAKLLVRLCREAKLGNALLQEAPVQCPDLRSRLYASAAVAVITNAARRQQLGSAAQMLWAFVATGAPGSAVSALPALGRQSRPATAVSAAAVGGAARPLSGARPPPVFLAPGRASCPDYVWEVAYTHPGVSLTDVLSLAVVSSVAVLGGPAIPWRAGRKDLSDGSPALAGLLHVKTEALAAEATARLALLEGKHVPQPRPSWAASRPAALAAQVRKLLSAYGLSPKHAAALCVPPLVPHTSLLTALSVPSVKPRRFDAARHYAVLLAHGDAAASTAAPDVFTVTLPSSSPASSSCVTVSVANAATDTVTYELRYVLTAFDRGVLADPEMRAAAGEFESDVSNQLWSEAVKEAITALLHVEAQEAERLADALLPNAAELQPLRSRFDALDDVGLQNGIAAGLNRMVAA